MKLLYFPLIFSCMLAILSCSKDLGNYNYKDINELDIKGVLTNYMVRTGLDTLHINPTITATEEQSGSDRYEYLWILKTGSLTFDTISRERNLSYPILLNPVPYDLFYRVMDKVTGVTWTANTKITVSTAYSRGLLIMGENESGFAEAEMLSMLSDTLHIKGILSKSGLPSLREPISLVHTAGDASYIRLWAMTKTGSYFLDRATMTATTANNLGRFLFTSDEIDPQTVHPVVIAPQVRTAAGAVGSTLYRALVTVGGDVFSSVPLIMGGDFYNNPINRVASAPDVRIPAAPYLLYPIGSMSSIMWYDTRNQRFLNHTSIGVSTSSTPLTDGVNDVFPWNQPVGRTLVYAENTRNTDGGSTNGNSFAIMKDTDNTSHIYKFYANGTNPAKRAAYKVKAIATDFDKASLYAFSSNRTVVFYAVGKTLYAYDYNPGFEKIYTFPELGDAEVTMVKFDTQMDHVVNSLYIATYDTASKGTLRRFRVGTNPNVVELSLQDNSTWTDMIKIKDINWRAIN
ncbi:PKD-like family lipoprotein [Sphingobacterium psychroaquaticum]|uniref:PKD-like family protein n=1 Tax=Sphingobacterium psychroaquaticum TaxID=561061 RepID=A0A1X7I7N1_9SPHI|nr:PKD-like family lipoprotein [Sphingobacterium psychroaquaticum]SMG10151.1 PKD-like family protein [Sphingobacterium psychroaquaticum]